MSFGRGRLPCRPLPKKRHNNQSAFGRGGEHVCEKLDVAANIFISSDALAIDALMLIREHNLKILPVVDNGRLRGVLHRRD